MRNATRVTVSTFGALAGLAGIEHGIGEMRKNAGLVLILLSIVMIPVLFFFALGFLLLTIFSGFAYDIQRQIDLSSGVFDQRAAGKRQSA